LTGAIKADLRLVRPTAAGRFDGFIVDRRRTDFAQQQAVRFLDRHQQSKQRRGFLEPMIIFLNDAGNLSYHERERQCR
jgi:hypothetical protein